MSNAAHLLRPPTSRRPNRAERRKAQSQRRGIRLKGPASYQVELFRLSDIFDGAIVGLIFGRPALALHSAQILDAANSLALRMQNTAMASMLCTFCDHEFARNEPPAELLLALPFANADHPTITSPVCSRCASADWANKRSKIAARFREILGPNIWTADQAGVA